MDLSIKITGDSRGAQQAIRGVTGDLLSLDSGLGSVASSIPGVGSALGALANPAALAGAAIGATVAAAGAMGAALAQAVSDTVDFGDRVGDLSAQLGIGAESLQTLQYAAERSGGSADSLRAAVKALTGNIAEAGDPTSKAAQQFAALGVATRDTAGAMRPVEDVLRDTIGALGDMGTGTDQAAAASQLLGRSYQDLLPLITQGRDGMAALEERARSLGGVMSEEDVEAASALDDALVDLRFAATGLWHEIGGALIPVLTQGAEQILEWVRSGELARGTMFGLEVAVRAAVSSIPMIGPALSAMVPHLQATADAAEDVRTSLGDDLFRPLAAAPAKVVELATATDSAAQAAGRARVEWDAWLDRMGAADTAIDLEGASAGWTAIADEQAAAMARRNADLGSFLDQPGAEIDLGATAASDMVALAALEEQQRKAADAARARAEAYQQELQGVSSALSSTAESASQFVGLLTDGADAATKKTAALTMGIIKLGVQMIAQMISTASTAQAEAVATSATLVAANSTNAASAGVAGALESTATFGASAAAGAGAFAAAVAAVTGTIGSIMGLISGIGDRGLGPDDMRRAGLLRHSVIAIRNDERVLSPAGTSAVDEMLEAWRTGDASRSGGRTVSVSSPVYLDGRMIAEVVSTHYVRDSERGLGWDGPRRDR